MIFCNRCPRHSFVHWTQLLLILLSQGCFIPANAQEFSEQRMYIFDSVHLDIARSPRRLDLLPHVGRETYRFAKVRLEGMEGLTHVTRSRPFVFLSAGVYGFAALDMYETKVTGVTRDSEEDPLAKPFVTLSRPAYFATGFALTSGINWVSWKMLHSRTWRKIWWLPQTAAMTGNLYGYVTTRRNADLSRRY